MSEDTYLIPPGGWVCFHCGECFRTPGAAADHFGAQFDKPALCQIKAGHERGLGMALRRAQALLLECAVFITAAEPSPQQRELSQAIVTYRVNWANELTIADAAEKLGREQMRLRASVIADRCDGSLAICPSGLPPAREAAQRIAAQIRALPVDEPYTEEMWRAENLMKLNRGAA